MRDGDRMHMRPRAALLGAFSVSRASHTPQHLLGRSFDKRWPWPHFLFKEHKGLFSWDRVPPLGVWAAGSRGGDTILSSSGWHPSQLSFIGNKLGAFLPEQAAPSF